MNSVVDTVIKAMYEYVKHQDYIRYHSLYKMSEKG